MKLRELAEVAMSSRRLICAAFIVLALTTATGCATSARSGQALVTPASSPVSADAGSFTSNSSSESPGANDPNGFSAKHRALASAAAHQEANRIAVGRSDQQVSGWPSGISAVTAVVGPGTVTDSNTGHACESGEIISVRLVGAFDTVTTGTSNGPGTFRSDPTVRELDLSVDATTGLTCLISARTEPVPPDPDAVVLYNR